MARHTVLHVVLFLLFLVVAAGLAAALAVVFAPVELTMKEEDCTLSFLFYKQSAAYAEIAEVALLEEEQYSSKKVKSYGGVSKAIGTYKNDTFGKHFRLTYSENDHNFIAIKKKDGSVTVFNQKTAKATSALYKKLLAKLTPETQEEAQES